MPVSAKPKTTNTKRLHFQKLKDNADKKMARTTDNLAAYDELYKTMLPMLQQDLKNGLTAQQILKKYSHLAAARVVTTAMDSEGDAKTALAAARDVLDRSEGKATETKIIKHQFAEMSDDELDAIILSKMIDVTPGKSTDE